MTVNSPTDFDQYMLALLNRFRTDPNGEYDRLINRDNDMASGIDHIAAALDHFNVDLASLQAQMTGLNAVAPLAWHGGLANSATTHSALMLEHNEQSHHLPGEPGLIERMRDGGYPNGLLAGENVYAYSYDAFYAHAGFVIDWGHDAEDFDKKGNKRANWYDLGDGIQDPAGHRNLMLDSRMVEVGIGVVPGSDVEGKVGPLLVTQHFGTRSGYQAQILGTIIDDADGDGFYDIGEGLGNVTVTATGANGTFTTTSWASGGYQIVAPAGSYTVTFEAGPVVYPQTHEVTIGTENVLLDAIAGQQRPARLIGTTDHEVLEVSGTPGWAEGRGGQDVLHGGAGDAYLFGKSPVAAHAGSDAAHMAFRLYQATLNRAPDVAGHAHWTWKLELGEMSARQAAAHFVASPEFQHRYAGLNDADFVTMLYQNVMNRTPNSGGYTHWTGKLAGGMARADVVMHFANSPEFVTKTDASAARYTAASDPTQWADEVFRLYDATLDRAPDRAGLESWCNALAGGKSLAQVAGDFINSPEFQLRYGGLDDRGFVTTLYNNVLDRAPDTAGLVYWMGRLEGGLGRSDVVLGFANSPENIAAQADPLMNWMRGRGGDDVLDGGGGDNRLAGGLWSDNFVFGTEPARTTVVDLEPWDFLVFHGWGFHNAAEARAAMEQVGDDVVITGPQTVVIEGTALASITDEMILLA